MSWRICVGPVALAWPYMKASRQSGTLPSLAMTLKKERCISTRTRASSAMPFVTFGPGTSTRYICTSRPPRSSTPKTSFRFASAGTSSWKRVTASSMRLFASSPAMVGRTLPPRRL